MWLNFPIHPTTLLFQKAAVKASKAVKWHYFPLNWARCILFTLQLRDFVIITTHLSLGRSSESSLDSNDGYPFSVKTKFGRFLLYLFIESMRKFPSGKCFNLRSSWDRRVEEKLATPHVNEHIVDFKSDSEVFFQFCRLSIALFCVTLNHMQTQNRYIPPFHVAGNKAENWNRETFSDELAPCSAGAGLQSFDACH